MSKKMEFVAQKREKAGKGVSRALRREGKVPAVIYGDNKEPVMITLSSRDVNVEYNKGHMFTSVAHVNADGEKFVCIARDIQLDPVKDFVLHVDFLRVSAKTKIHVNVPLHYVGQDECKALSQGGILMAERHEIELLCSAMSIPEVIEVDVSALEIGSSIMAKDIKLPAKVELGTEDDKFHVVSVAAPRVVSEDDEEAADAEAADGETSEEAA